MTPGTRLLVALAVVAVAAALMVAFRGGKEKRDQPSGSKVARGAALSPSAPGHEPRPTAPSSTDQRANKSARRNELLGRIGAARRKRLGSRTPGTEASTAEEVTAAMEGSLDKESIRTSMREVVLPLLVECYTAALETSPDLGGTLKVHFAIVGEPEVGGIIEDSQVVREGPLGEHAELAECVQESMYALELPAPEDGGRVEVVYPFEFRPDDGE